MVEIGLPFNSFVVKQPIEKEKYNMFDIKDRFGMNSGYKFDAFTGEVRNSLDNKLEFTIDRWTGKFKDPYGYNTGSIFDPVTSKITDKYGYDTGLKINDPYLNKLWK